MKWCTYYDRIAVVTYSKCSSDLHKSWLRLQQALWKLAFILRTWLLTFDCFHQMIRLIIIRSLKVSIPQIFHDIFFILPWNMTGGSAVVKIQNDWETHNPNLVTLRLIVTYFIVRRLIVQWTPSSPETAEYSSSIVPKSWSPEIRV